jgi:hypothetical protein
MLMYWYIGRKYELLLDTTKEIASELRIGHLRITSQKRYHLSLVAGTGLF